jgi:hypothetical protein
VVSAIAVADSGVPSQGEAAIARNPQFSAQVHTKIGFAIEAVPASRLWLFLTARCFRKARIPMREKSPMFTRNKQKSVQVHTHFG